jgi:hypothetical protein
MAYNNSVAKLLTNHPTVANKTLSFSVCTNRGARYVTTSAAAVAVDPINGVRSMTTPSPDVPDSRAERLLALA